MNAHPYEFADLHIDAARNATDDFNLFHDKSYWRRIRDNPFGGPIALGFQLEALVAEALWRFREREDEWALIEAEGLRYSNYQFTFVSVARRGDRLGVEIKPSRWRGGVLANRVSLRKPGAIVLTGYKKETREPLLALDTGVLPAVALNAAADREFLPGSDYFLKRKFLSVANAKNFLLGSLIEQSLYFDELRGRVRFPEMFPAALLSCALLERALKLGHDFEQEPSVYVSHSISIDRDAVAALASHDRLHILVSGAGKEYFFDCLCVVNEDRPLYRAQITVAPLSSIQKKYAAQT